MRTGYRLTYCYFVQRVKPKLMDIIGPSIVFYTGHTLRNLVISSSYEYSVQVGLILPIYSVVTCTCVGIHLGLVEPAPLIELTTLWTEGPQAQWSCVSSLETCAAIL